MLNRGNAKVKEYLGRAEREDEMYQIRTDHAVFLFIDSDVLFNAKDFRKAQRIEQHAYESTLNATGRRWKVVFADK